MTGDNRSLVASARKGSAWPRTTRTLIASSLHEHRSISKVLLCQPTAHRSHCREQNFRRSPLFGNSRQATTRLHTNIWGRRA
jgi:hypothetical protein